MPPILSLSGFREDSRGDRLQTYELMERDGEPERYLCLLGPEAAARQVLMCAGDARQTSVGLRWRRAYSHQIALSDEPTDDVYELLDLLTEALSLRTRQYVDFAVALDWYKVPDDDVPPKDWKNTEAGRLNNAAKYRGVPAARAKLLKWMLDTVERHALLRNAATVVTVPGHAGDGRSFGERLARKIGNETDKRVVNTRSHGPHEPSKTGSKHQYGDFEIDEKLDGDVLIVDDVYRSGMSMSVAAHAAKQAGAARVFGLVVARTLRN